MLKLTNKCEQERDLLKTNGWVLKEINHIYKGDEVIEIKVVYTNERFKDLSVTINTKSQTIMPSNAMSFKDICKIAEIAVNGGFDIYED